ncbi:unnamed protein product [Symbiodinium sp. CCMP2456]|nr:unnamed protein product [Symbiodinium sp. CCMP2456]
MVPMNRVPVMEGRRPRPLSSVMVHGHPASNAAEEQAQSEADAAFRTTAKLAQPRRKFPGPRGAVLTNADLYDDAGTQRAPWRSQKAGGKRQLAKGTWKEQKTKRKVEYAGDSPPAQRRKSWSTDNWVGHEGRVSERGDSSWDGPSHQRGYRHAKPMDEDWSQWKAWKDAGTWRGSSSSSNRGWSWKRR